MSLTDTQLEELKLEVMCALGLFDDPPKSSLVRLLHVKNEETAERRYILRVTDVEGLMESTELRLKAAVELGYIGIFQDGPTTWRVVVRNDYFSSLQQSISE